MKALRVRVQPRMFHHSLRFRRLLAVAAAVLFLARCSTDQLPVSPSPPVSPPPASWVAAGVPSTFVGAGDIANCRTAGAEATARLLDGIPGIVFTTGDNAYPSGSAADFRNCYAPTWGRHLARTRPVPGNHEYERSASASAYFDYFGERAGPRGRGYYAYDAGSWRIYALNSEAPSGPGSAQMTWLRGKIAERPSVCSAAYWHRPLFSSGRNGDSPDMRDLWRTLHDARVDLVINGHDHSYERFGPQDPDGRPDPRGIRQFVVGTGGTHLDQFVRIRPNSEVRGSTWGVAVFRLFDGGYQWEFVPVAGSTFQDSGSAACVA